ncbi:alpha/beta fold hydrolase [Luteimonas suaedae]|uniref:alpha/beta fold hydrolase n=1 Tax=Luteimonas suaedae TaxID=2605430 RepID=UPI0011EE1011|nr:alpha/beta fold hydrolase [Luteimonas suaedae]
MTPAVLFLHGAGAGGWEWNVWRAVFEAAGLATAAPDLQPAASGLAHTTLDDYAAQARAALQALPRPRVLVGASLGGLLAAMCAHEADALVLVNPLPPAPWHEELPPRAWPAIVPWRHEVRLASTRRALPDADEATALYAFRHWRDESGRVLGTAHAGVAIERPSCPLLCMTSTVDDDVPPAVTAALAAAWGADLLRSPAISHVGPLLGRDAAAAAQQALAWCRGSKKPANVISS